MRQASDVHYQLGPGWECYDAHGHALTAFYRLHMCCWIVRSCAAHGLNARPDQACTDRSIHMLANVGACRTVRPFVCGRAALPLRDAQRDCSSPVSAA